jgi:hypothetical protein
MLSEYQTPSPLAKMPPSILTESRRGFESFYARDQVLPLIAVAGPRLRQGMPTDRLHMRILSFISPILPNGLRNCHRNQLHR